MKKTSALLIAVCLLSVGSISQIARAGDADWRSASTNTIAQGLSRTSAAREKWLQDASQSMLNFLHNEHDTPEMVFAAEDGVISIAPTIAIQNSARNTIPLNYTLDANKQGFHYDQVPRIDITGLGPSGILRGTLLLPVSGHTGLANAKQWAISDKYTIVLQTQAGRQTLVSDAPSRAMVTSQELEIHMVPNTLYRVLYFRSGSGGPPGYPDGRTYDIYWDGK